MPRMTPAVVRSLDIMEAIGRASGPTTFTDLAVETGLPRASLHEILHTLTERGYLQRTGTPPAYNLGIRAYRLGLAYAGRIELADIAQGVAEEVAAATTETVSVALRDGAEVFYVCKVESQHPVRMPSQVGRGLPACCTSVGKALLAYLSDHELRALFPDPSALPVLTASSMKTLDELTADLALTRKRGYSLEFGEAAEGVTCLGAPIRDRNGDVVASISTSVPDIRWKQRPESAWADDVITGANKVSELLGAPA